jgi:transcriptional regulator with XRE-family HTH domain
MSNHPLKSYRAAARISLEELASLVGASKASLSRIETGLQTPSLGLVRRIVGVSGGALTANDFAGEPDREVNKARA